MKIIYPRRLTIEQVIGHILATQEDLPINLLLTAKFIASDDQVVDQIMILEADDQKPASALEEMGIDLPDPSQKDFILRWAELVQFGWSGSNDFGPN